jgi:hypothetical protein
LKPNLWSAHDCHSHGFRRQPDHHKSRPNLNGGVLRCTKTSGADVYSHSIWTTTGSIRQFTMFAGDSIVVPPGSTLTIWIFRKEAGKSTWTMDFELDESAAKPAEA